ncbi:hypothetical protein PG985_003738 [Apiospora marii]|uniref:Uncharacterized protein n=1 Tax=Apiospora marii TaxID=335849 RepID=A0ABR1SH75_9PEZI
MDQRVPTRGGQTATAAAQKTLGLSRKRTQTQQKNPPAKRTRALNTPSQAESMLALMLTTILTLAANHRAYRTAFRAKSHLKWWRYWRSQEPEGLHRRHPRWRQIQAEASAAGTHATPAPATMAGSSMNGATAYFSGGQSSAVQASNNGVQSVAAGSEPSMRAVLNSFNGLSVNGGPVPLYDANAAAAAMRFEKLL